jgi:hypothetical protein
MKRDRCALGKSKAIFLFVKIYIEESLLYSYSEVIRRIPILCNINVI